jgi:hypothetical protein
VNDGLTTLHGGIQVFSWARGSGPPWFVPPDICEH